jgi:hypothetical protein
MPSPTNVNPTRDRDQSWANEWNLWSDSVRFEPNQCDPVGRVSIVRVRSTVLCASTASVSTNSCFVLRTFQQILLAEALNASRSARRFELSTFAELGLALMLLASGRLVRRRKHALARLSPSFRPIRLVCWDSPEAQRRRGICTGRRGKLEPSGIRQWQEDTKSRSMVIALWRAAASCCWTQH